QTMATELAAVKNRGQQLTAVGALFERLAKKDPASAAAQAATVPDGIRAGSINAVLSVWAATDSKSASDWLKGMPAGSGRDAGFAGLATRLKDSDPDGASSAANNIQDGRLRNSVLKQIGRQP